MVSKLEKSIWISGLFGIYTYGIYNVYKNYNQITVQHYLTVCNRSESLLKSRKFNDINFVPLENNKKLIFIVGINNNFDSVKSQLKAIKDIIYELTPDTIILDRNIL